MNDVTPSTVRDIRRIIKDGEERKFPAVQKPTGDEPQFYRVSTRGEFLNAIPAWTNAPALEYRPMPAMRDRVGISLSTLGEFHYTLNASEQRMADLYRISVCHFLLSDNLFKALHALGCDEVETASASIVTPDAIISRYKTVMPLRVVDAVDVTKTEVTAYRRAPGRSTVVRYDRGYTLRSDILGNTLCFVEEFSGEWLWRRELFDAARRGGCRGVRGVLTQGGPVTSEIEV